MSKVATKTATDSVDTTTLALDELRAEIVRLQKEHGDDWRMHFDFLHPSPSRETIIALNVAAKELQGQAAARRADAGRPEKGREFPGTEIASAALVMAEVLGDESLAFERGWMINSIIMGAQNLLNLRERQIDEAKQGMREAERDYRGGEIDRSEMAEFESRCSEAEGNADMVEFWLRRLKTAYFRAMGRAWTPPRQMARASRPRFSTVERGNRYERDDDDRRPMRSMDRRRDRRDDDYDRR